MRKFSYCFIPGCKTGYPNQRKKYKVLGKKAPSLFSCKSGDNTLLQKWKLVMRRADREFTFKDRVCELHFDENDIQRNYVTNLPDGSTHVLERGWATLEPGAIPCIFEGLPPDSSKKPPEKRKLSEEPSSLDLPVPGDSVLERFDIACNIQFVNMPSHWWTIHSAPNFVICTKWNENYLVERKVIIKDDLSIKIFLEDHELKDREERISNVHDLSVLLKEVDSYKIIVME